MLYLYHNILLPLLIIVSLAEPIYSKETAKYSSNELRDLVAESLKATTVDLERMKEYVYNETETFINKTDKTNKKNKTIINKKYYPSFKKEYVWFFKNGSFVRSPTTINGNIVDPSQRKMAEELWKKRKQSNKRSITDYIWEFTSEYLSSVLVHPPSFIKNELLFDFAQGTYIYNGDKTYEGHNIIEIQYLPTVTGIAGKSTLRLVIYLMPKEKRIVKIAFGGGSNQPYLNFTNIFGVTMAIQGDGIWLPHKYSIFFTNNDKKEQFVYTREYHSFVRTDVKSTVTYDEIVTDSLQETK